MTPKLNQSQKMSDHLGKDMRKVKDKEEGEKEIKGKRFYVRHCALIIISSVALDEADIQLLKTYVSIFLVIICSEIYCFL